LSGTAFLDEDDMSSNSATKAASQQSIKAYVDAQVDTADTLSEVLAIGNTTGGTDVSVSTDDKVQFRDAAIYINSSTDGQLDIVADTEIQIAATTIDINGAVALNGALTGITNITLSGELDAATGDFSGDVDVDGTLEADAITLGGTALGSLYSPIAGSSSIVTTGALNSGSITSGFGTINNGASAITTTGALGAGAATFAGDVSIPALSELYFDGGSNTYIEEGAADNLWFYCGGSRKLRIGSAGMFVENTNATFAGEIRADYASANIIAEFGGTGETGQIGFSFTGTDVGGLDYAYNTRTTVGMRAWTPNSYPITIDAGGGSSSSNKIFFKTNTSTTALTISSTDTATFAGAISKASGSFKIPHPLPELNETHNLVHSFVESPRAENLYSGMATLVDGTASVNIDTHSGMTEGTFEALNTLLTHSSSNESSYSPVKCSVVNNVITINCQDATSTDKVYWEVRGERKDQHMIDTEWTDDEGHVIVEPEVVAETETEAEAEA
jgi:cytoskeletal protein CcmA (bactofilin family)